MITNRFGQSLSSTARVAIALQALLSVIVGLLVLFSVAGAGTPGCGGHSTDCAPGRYVIGLGALVGLLLIVSGLILGVGAVQFRTLVASIAALVVEGALLWLSLSFVDGVGGVGAPVIASAAFMTALTGAAMLVRVGASGAP